MAGHAHLHKGCDSDEERLLSGDESELHLRRDAPKQTADAQPQPLEPRVGLGVRQPNAPADAGGLWAGRRRGGSGRVPAL